MPKFTDTSIHPQSGWCCCGFRQVAWRLSGEIFSLAVDMSQAQRCLGRWFPPGELPIALEEGTARSPWGLRSFAESPVAQWGAATTESLGATMVSLTQAPTWKVRGGDGHSTTRANHVQRPHSPRSEHAGPRSLSPPRVGCARFTADQEIVAGPSPNVESLQHLSRPPPDLPTRQRHWLTILPRETSVGHERQDRVQAFFVTCSPGVPELFSGFDTRQGLRQITACESIQPEQSGGDQGDAPVLTPRTESGLNLKECVSIDLDESPETALGFGGRSEAAHLQGRADGFGFTNQWCLPR
mmetsp:Transcript_59947/g.129320  ORF Transcript_59947/g.129320 Transcript_59947/m.129320 type:complete len:298 (+) Transcript_59947:1102-1995(+)